MMGRGKGEEWKRAFSLFPSSPRAFYFFSIIAIFTGIPSGSLCGGVGVTQPRLGFVKARELI